MRKSLVICATQLAGGLLLKMLKYFEVMLDIFSFCHAKNIVESWLVYVNKFSQIMRSLFLTETIKPLYHLLFLTCLTFLFFYPFFSFCRNKKQKFNFQQVGDLVKRNISVFVYIKPNSSSKVWWIQQTFMK